jgi:O-acetyl-ADP-ribose deacetylase (regulator of RNase III)
MTGGFDLSVVCLLGDYIQEQVRKILKSKFPSEEESDSWDCANQPIGTSILIKTDFDKIKYLCHTPTMEFARNIQGKPNIYMAMNSILYEILKHNQSCLPCQKIEIIVIPFLGTGFGELSFDESAKQMSDAYKFYAENYPDYY